MDNCYDYELYKCILIEYIYNAVANKRVIHLMKHGRTERIRNKNWKRYCYERRLFIKRRIKK